MSPVQFRVPFGFQVCLLCLNLCKTQVKAELSGKPWSDSQLWKGPGALYAVMADKFVFTLIPLRMKGYKRIAYVVVHHPS